MTQGPWSIAETMGFLYIVLSVGMFTALLAILAGLGAAVAWKCMLLGEKEFLTRIRLGQDWRGFIRDAKDERTEV